MRLSWKSSFLVLAFFALFPLESFAAPASAAEACEKISEMLLEQQLAALQAKPADFHASQRALKDAFRRLCEGQGRASTARLEYRNGQAIEKEGKWFFPNAAEYHAALFSDAAANARIVGPFTRAHGACAPGCSYTSWGIWGDEAHQARRSCHNSGEAIDIHAITCGGRTSSSLSARFDSYVDCMRGHLGVIYRRGPGDHEDHAHYELHNCNMCSGLGCGGSGNGGGDDEEDGGSRPGQGRGNDGDDESGDDESGDDESGDDESGDDEG